MCILKIRVFDMVCEIDVPENYLQSRFGTFHNEHTPFKMERSNWDNSQFFNYQSKPVFKICIDRFRRNINQKIKPDEKDIQRLVLLYEKDNPMKSQSEIAEMVKRDVDKSSATEEKRVYVNEYVTVTAFFLKGEWRFRTEYEKGDIERTPKKQPNVYPVLTGYKYTDDELGLFDSNENIFDQLFK